MTRKVSLWIVIALVGALAATTAAVIVLATHDHDSWSASGLPSAQAYPHVWNDGQNDRHVPMMGDMRGGWGDGRDAPVLPWVLFALATGTAVGLLVAWRPWRAAGAGAAAGTFGAGGDTTQTQTDVVRETPVDETHTVITPAEVTDAQTTEVDETRTAAEVVQAQKPEEPAETAPES